MKLVCIMRLIAFGTDVDNLADDILNDIEIIDLEFKKSMTILFQIITP